jgi:polar amino acid transport system substrate-binding protein
MEIRRLIADINAFARASGPVAGTTFVVNEAVERTVRLMRQVIDRSTDSFDLSLAEDLPPVRGDIARFTHAVVNLLGNALQSLPDRRSGVHVATRLDPGGARVVLEVADQGQGMDAGQIAALGNWRTSKPDGHGLGVALTQLLVHELGGELRYTSERGRGTSVTISLPVAEADPALLGERH